jgi:hypothetical protein
MTNTNSSPSLFPIPRNIFSGLLLPLGLLICVSTARAQEGRPHSASLPQSPCTAFFNAQNQQQNPPPATSGTPTAPTAASQSNPAPQNQSESTPPGQPQRILGVMPNFRAVSAGAIPPPPTPKQAFKIATQNSFDYSSFIFAGLTSMIAEGDDTHPQLGKGVAGFGRYYWRGFLDKVDGNYQVIFIFATALHEDERYYAKGRGGFWKRFVYSTTRILITPNYDGKNTFNAAEFLGRGGAQAVSISYYPSKTRTVAAISEKFGYALLRDAATNAFREFWPDIAVHVLHRHP